MVFSMKFPEDGLDDDIIGANEVISATSFSSGLALVEGLVLSSLLFLILIGPDKQIRSVIVSL